MSTAHVLVYTIWFGVSVAVGYFGAKWHAAYLRRQHRQSELDYAKLRTLARAKHAAGQAHVTIEGSRPWLKS